MGLIACVMGRFIGVVAFLKLMAFQRVTRLQSSKLPPESGPELQRVPFVFLGFRRFRAFGE